MKKRISRILIAATLAFLILSAQDISAQAIEINSFAGWQLGGTAKLYDGDFRIQDAMNYGGRISVGMSTTTYAEITYMRSDTEGRFYPYGLGSPSDNIEFSSNYIQIGGVQEVHFGPVAPFATIAMGLTVWDPKTNVISSKTQFSFAGGAGVKIWLTDFLGIRLQGTALMPLVYNGFGFGCGVSSGGSSCGSSLYTRVTPFQGEFSGGIMIKLSPN